jgi:hypothetical protein
MNDIDDDIDHDSRYHSLHYPAVFVLLVLLLLLLLLVLMIVVYNGIDDDDDYNRGVMMMIMIITIMMIDDSGCWFPIDDHDRDRYPPLHTHLFGS